MNFFICPHCNQQYEFEAEFVDKNIECSNCTKSFKCVDIAMTRSGVIKTIAITGETKIIKHIFIHLPKYQEYEKRISSEQYTRILELSPTIDLLTIRELDEKQARLVIDQLEQARLQYRDNHIEGLFVNNFDLLDDSLDIVDEAELIEKLPDGENIVFKEKPINESLIKFNDYINAVNQKIEQIDNLSEMLTSTSCILLEDNLLHPKLKEKLENAICDFDQEVWMHVCNVYKHSVKKITDRMDILYTRFCNDEWLLKCANTELPSNNQFYEICFYLDQVQGVDWAEEASNLEPYSLIRKAIKIIFPVLISL